MGDRLQGRAAFITGAGSGFGRAMARRFALEGARIFCVDVSGNESVVAAELGGDAVALHADVADPTSVAAAVAAAVALGGFDIVCNNAGIGGARGRVHELSMEDFDRVHAVNVRGAFCVLRETIPVLLARGGGSIVNTASIGSFLATPGSSPYISSKGAMLMLTRTAALEYVGDNIRVNAVCPGVADTAILGSSTPALLGFLGSQVPMGRIASAEDIANLALFLASDEASYITGAAYIIDGGRSAG